MSEMKESKRTHTIHIQPKPTPSPDDGEWDSDLIGMIYIEDEEIRSCEE